MTKTTILTFGFMICSTVFGYSAVTPLSSTSENMTATDRIAYTSPLAAQAVSGVTGLEAIALAFATASEGRLEEATALYINAVENDDSLLEVDDGGLLDDAVKMLTERIETRGLETDMLTLARVLAVKGDIPSSEAILEKISARDRRDPIAAEARKRLVALRFFSTL